MMRRMTLDKRARLVEMVLISILNIQVCYRFLKSADLKLVNCNVFNVKIQLEPILILIVSSFQFRRYFRSYCINITNLMSQFAQTGCVADLPRDPRHRITS